MKIELKKFVATEADIKALTQEHLQSTEGVSSTRSTYLRALIGTTQAESKGADGTALQVLKGVQARFYAVVLATVISDGNLADHHRLGKEERASRALERNRRSNFARTSYSVLRAWLKAGQDLATLVPSKVTKSQLVAETPVRATRQKITATQAQTRTDALVNRVLETTRVLAAVNPTQARAVLDAAMQRIAKELFQGAVTPTTDAAEAFKEHRPLKAAGGLFWPTESQVMRRQRLKAAA